MSRWRALSNNGKIILLHQEKPCFLSHSQKSKMHLMNKSKTYRREPSLQSRVPCRKVSECSPISSTTNTFPIQDLTLLSQAFQATVLNSTKLAWRSILPPN